MRWNNKPDSGSVGVEEMQTVDKTYNSVIDSTQSSVDDLSDSSMNSCSGVEANQSEIDGRSC